MDISFKLTILLGQKKSTKLKTIIRVCEKHSNYIKDKKLNYASAHYTQAHIKIKKKKGAQEVIGPTRGPITVALLHGHDVKLPSNNVSCLHT